MASAQKLGLCLYQMVEFDDMFIRIDRIPECVSETDGRICHNKLALHG